MFFSKFVVITLMSFCFHQNTVSASEGFDKDPLAGLSFSKEEIAKSLETLKNSGKISDADYKKATTELMGMSQNQINALKEAAVGMVRNNPDKAVELVQKGSFDAEATKKQISDLSKPKD